MINLLPEETKRNYRAARANVTLRRYVFVLAGSLVFMVACFGAGYYVTLQDRVVAQEDLNTFQSEATKYAEVKRESEEFASNLSTTKSILSSEIIFSELIVNIAKTLPEGAILSNLTIGAESLEDEVALAARTTDTNETPLKLKQALEESDLFENVSIVTISNATVETSTSGSATAIQEENAVVRSHPVTVNLTATMSKPKLNKAGAP